MAACWYDRRLDVVNFFIERSCGVSTDGGATFSNSVTSTLWEPWHATDVFVDPTYMGDYDTVASDATGSTAGFLGAFQVIKKRGAAANRLLVPNPDVFAVRLQ